MPTPDEQYTPLCSDCQTQYASSFCDECNRLFCESCSSSFHKSGQRKLHHLVQLEMCIECGFQVPTKQCLSCDEMYCDTCFHFAHRRGRSRLHTYRWVTQRCDICEMRAAHYRHVDTWNRYQEQLYCTICFKESWGDDALAAVALGDTNAGSWGGQYETYPVQYYGPSVTNYRTKKLNEEMEQKKKEDYEKLAKENLKRKQEKNSIIIQRVWRGRQVRHHLQHWLERRRYFLSQRELEMPKRQTKLYQFLQFIGWTPSLKYDTNREKILRRFPKYLHETVSDCLERKWGKFTDLLVPADLGTSNPDDTSKAQAFKTLLGLTKAKCSLYLAEKYLQRCEKKHQVARDKYRAVSFTFHSSLPSQLPQARSSATMKAERKKKLQSDAHDCLKAVERAKTKVGNNPSFRETDVLFPTQRDEETDSVAYARKKWEHFAGPRGVPNLVHQRRSEGIPMPFTIDMASGSRYALVKYDVTTPDSVGLSYLRCSSSFLQTPDPYFNRNSPPGSWKRKLKEGDVLLIRGMHFKVVVGEDILDIIEEFEGENDQSDDEYEVDTNATPVVTATADNKGQKEAISRKSSKLSGIKSSTSMPAEAKQQLPLDDQSLEGEQVAPANPLYGNIGRPLRKAYTMLPLRSSSRVVTHRLGEVSLDHIKLDRTWLFDDIENLSVYKIAKKPFYSQPVFQVTRFPLSLDSHGSLQLERICHESWITQQFISFTAILFDKLSQTVSSFSKAFDEESETGAWFVDQGNSLAETRDWLMKASRKV